MRIFPKRRVTHKEKLMEIAANYGATISDNIAETIAAEYSEIPLSAFSTAVTLAFVGFRDNAITLDQVDKLKNAIAENIPNVEYVFRTFAESRRGSGQTTLC